MCCDAPDSGYILKHLYGTCVVRATTHPLSQTTTEMRGTQALWRAVILQALVDAANRSTRPEHVREREAALQWLTRRSRDFFMVCDYADLDPDYVRTAVRGALSRHCRWRKEGAKKRKPSASRQAPAVPFYEEAL